MTSPSKPLPWRRYKRRSAQVEAFRNLTGRPLDIRGPQGPTVRIAPGEWAVRDNRGTRALLPEVFEQLYERVEED